MATVVSNAAPRVIRRQQSLREQTERARHHHQKKADDKPWHQFVQRRPGRFGSICAGRNPDEQ